MYQMELWREDLRRYVEFGFTSDDPMDIQHKVDVARKLGKKARMVEILDY